MRHGIVEFKPVAVGVMQWHLRAGLDAVVWFAEPSAVYRTLGIYEAVFGSSSNDNGDIDGRQAGSSDTSEAPVRKRWEVLRSSGSRAA
jgi:hypothetical protein